MARKRSTSAPTQNMVGGNEVAPQAPLFQTPIARAESLLLDLADYAYAHSSLKPMSKALFFISRLLLIDKGSGLKCGDDPAAIADAYREVVGRTSIDTEGGDYKFEELVRECAKDLGRFTQTIRRIRTLTDGSDAMGLAFSTLLRGRWEAGEGLGTFLTPEEVVQPMVEMAVSTIDDRLRRDPMIRDDDSLLFGDVTAGTGRFVRTAIRELKERWGDAPAALAKRYRGYDQSMFCIQSARIQFALDGLPSTGFHHVRDSLVEGGLSRLKGRFFLLATNPPFGSGKYDWSPSLAVHINPQLLHAIGLAHAGNRADPALAFLARNLELLCEGGVLAIVLPDGVIQSPRLPVLLRAFESATGSRISLNAVVSLPVATFALGGTVAKTSFVILRRDGIRTRRRIPAFAAVAAHVGFSKKGNRRVSDEAGNELVAVAADYCSGSESMGRRTVAWEDADVISAPFLLHCVEKTGSASAFIQLGEMTQWVREFESRNDAGPLRKFHISVLDVDETGLVDIRSAANNRPAGPGLACLDNDILVSCLNPRIWRIALVPEGLSGTWTCSPEFAVLRPKPPWDAWTIFALLLNPTVRAQALAKARGTSSSRQRVPKSSLPDFKVPRTAIDAASAWSKSLKRVRVEHYLARFREMALFSEHLSALMNEGGQTGAGSSGAANAGRPRRGIPHDAVVGSVRPIGPK